MFEKLAKYIGRDVEALITRADDPHCFRVVKNRVYYISEAIMRLATNARKDNLRKFNSFDYLLRASLCLLADGEKEALEDKLNDWCEADATFMTSREFLYICDLLEVLQTARGAPEGCDDNGHAARGKASVRPRGGRKPVPYEGEFWRWVAQKWRDATTSATPPRSASASGGNWPRLRLSRAPRRMGSCARSLSERLKSMMWYTPRAASHAMRSRDPARSASGKTISFSVL